jgi:hypothetical protein
VQGIRNLIERTESRVDVITVLSKYNTDSAVGAYKLSRELGVNSHLFSLMFLYGCATPDKLPPISGIRDVVNALLLESEKSGESTRLLVNNVPLCLLGTGLNRSLNYLSLSINPVHELIIQPGYPNRFIFSPMNSGTSSTYPENCSKCFLRAICPGPKILRHFEDPGINMLPFQLNEDTEQSKQSHFEHTVTEEN